MMMENKSTEKLLNRLNKIESESQLTKFINSSSPQENNYLLSEYILKICKAKGYNKSTIIQNSDIYRTYGYEILNGKKSPSRDKLLQICIGNGFTLDEANRTLTIAKLGILYAKYPRDSILIYALNNDLSIIDINILLDQHNFKPLGES